MEMLEQAKLDNQQAVPGANKQTDFRRPALAPPGVMNPVLGGRQEGVSTGGTNIHQRTTSYGSPLVPMPVSPNVSCFSCGRRGHYSMTCPYPPLPPHEQEKLR